MADFASRSFGQPSNWHCPNDSSFGLAFNTLFPLPKQNTWTVFRPSNAICMRVISLLRMRHSTLDEWRRIPLIGQTNGKIGAPMSTLWEWTQVCNSRGLQNGSGSSLDTPPAQEQDSTAEEDKSKLRRFLQLSRPLGRQSRWSTRDTPSK